MEHLCQLVRLEQFFESEAVQFSRFPFFLFLCSVFCRMVVKIVNPLAYRIKKNQQMRFRSSQCFQQFLFIVRTGWLFLVRGMLFKHKLGGEHLAIQPVNA